MFSHFNIVKLVSLCGLFQRLFMPRMLSCLAGCGAGALLTWREDTRQISRHLAGVSSIANISQSIQFLRSKATY